MMMMMMTRTLDRMTSGTQSLDNNQDYTMMSLNLMLNAILHSRSSLVCLIQVNVFT